LLAFSFSRSPGKKLLQAMLKLPADTASRLTGAAFLGHQNSARHSSGARTADKAESTIDIGPKIGLAGDEVDKVDMKFTQRSQVDVLKPSILLLSLAK
jgi:hypothetical protein